MSSREIRGADEHSVEISNRPLRHTSFRKMNHCLAGRLLAKIEYSCMASALTVAHGVLAAALVFGLSAKIFFLPSQDVTHTTKTLLCLQSCVPNIEEQTATQQVDTRL
ncbi:hypothetical protein M747DRAFT_299774 [Aspergillus niger ATCC 13496]|uniref:Uncharacterized protein n=1 Tax=Aspergillus niger ATCC 13496 TaxID=1353008 RepID=A0A370BKN6_ASPNG|nr:hypothetical protein M747DRAFT_299774 [Aspergillus niger ATCC 13496]